MLAFQFLFLTMSSGLGLSVFLDATLPLFSAEELDRKAHENQAILRNKVQKARAQLEEDVAKAAKEKQQQIAQQQKEVWPELH